MRPRVILILKQTQRPNISSSNSNDITLGSLVSCIGTIYVPCHDSLKSIKAVLRIELASAFSRKTFLFVSKVREYKCIIRIQYNEHLSKSFEQKPNFLFQKSYLATNQKLLGRGASNALKTIKYQGATITKYSHKTHTLNKQV